MLEFIGKYFLEGSVHQNFQYVGFYLMVVVSACFGAFSADWGLSGGVSSKKERRVVMAVLAFLTVLFFLLVTWLTHGDSAPWSAPIGDWLAAKP